jgi:hypothetical protein
MTLLAGTVHDSGTVSLYVLVVPGMKTPRAYVKKRTDIEY